MPLREFKKYGHPTAGQWVMADLTGYDVRSYEGKRLTGTMLGIVVEAEHDAFQKTGDMVTGKPPIAARGGPHIPPHDWKVRDISSWQVDIVNPKTGMETIANALLAVNDFSPISDASLIPATRRSTMLPDFVPEP